MDKQRREELINKYATEVVDAMDFENVCLTAVELIESNLKHYTDQEIIDEIKETHHSYLLDE